MINEIKHKYSHFHDAQIYNIHFTDVNYISNLELTINCMNNQNEYKFEKIKMFFFDIDFFNLKYRKNNGILSLFACFLKEENELITIDFDCIYFDEDNLKENPNSEFIIKCKEITYEVLEQD